jgi:hypothetical protein
MKPETGVQSVNAQHFFFAVALYFQNKHLKKTERRDFNRLYGSALHKILQR